MEDDGWLLVQVYRPRAHVTEVAVLDARRVAAGPVCVVRLPFHLPLPFHCTFAPVALLGLGGVDDEDDENDGGSGGRDARRARL